MTLPAKCLTDELICLGWCADPFFLHPLNFPSLLITDIFSSFYFFANSSLAFWFLLLILTADRWVCILFYASIFLPLKSISTLLWYLKSWSVEVFGDSTVCCHISCHCPSFPGWCLVVSTPVFFFLLQKVSNCCNGYAWNLHKGSDWVSLFFSF